MCKIVTINYDGTETEVEVSKAVYNLMIESQTAIDTNDRTARRHCRYFNSYSWNNFSFLSAQSVEDDYISSLEQESKEHKAEIQLRKICNILSTCTSKQRIRFLLYALHGYTQREIANLQGCSQTAVRLSIEQVKKKFESFS